MAGGIPTSFNIGAKVSATTAAANYVAGASAKGTKWATNYLNSKVNPFQAAISRGKHVAAKYQLCRHCRFPEGPRLGQPGASCETGFNPGTDALQLRHHE